jgi:hypothetical protein
MDIKRNSMNIGEHHHAASTILETNATDPLTDVRPRYKYSSLSVTSIQRILWTHSTSPSHCYWLLSEEDLFMSIP